MGLYSGLTNKYGVVKSLRFELVPQGKTLEHFESNGILREDEQRAIDAKLLKTMIDEIHKNFISDCLKDIELAGLSDYCFYYFITNKTEKEKQLFTKCKELLRKQISECFTKNPEYKKLFNIELFKELLPKKFTGAAEQELIKKFYGFTTYFSDYNKTRENIYTHEEKVGSIAYRLINENLPSFIQNTLLFEAFKRSSAGLNLVSLKEDLSGLVSAKVEDYFSLDGFNLVLTQQGITEYNLLIGGYSKENGEKVKGLNEYINLYNQNSGRQDRLWLFKPLKKQILSEIKSFSFVPESFETDEQVLQTIDKYTDILEPIVYSPMVKGHVNSMYQLLLHIADYDLEGIFIRADFINHLSQHLCGHWSILSKAMEAWYDEKQIGTKKPGTKAYKNEKEKYFKNKVFYSIGFLNECCKAMEETKHIRIEQYFFKYANSDGHSFYLLLRQLKEEMQETLAINFNKNASRPAKRKLSAQTVKVQAIKKYLDAVKDYQFFLKPLMLKNDISKYDRDFYDAFIKMYEDICGIDLIYNKVRNYLTKKPYSNEKIKLNFSNANLLSGWSLSKEKDCTATILRKDGFYYLGIINKNHRKIFDEYPSDGDVYEKMEYFLFPGPNKMLPKMFLVTKDAPERYGASDEILRIYRTGSFKKGDAFSLDDCHALIDYFKKCLTTHEELKQFNFEFSDTSSYEDISSFYREVETQGYRINFRNISKSYVDGLVESGMLYLFQIYCKDFSPYSKKTSKLNTMYFKALFSPENLADVVYKLNGENEIFYRRKSIEKEDVIVHPANEPIENKNPRNSKKESLFTYDIYKDRRYTVDKFHWHLSISMNFKAEGSNRLNAIVNKTIKENPDTYVIGINRGERHLLYVSVVDSKGDVVEQRSLNEIVSKHNDTIHTVNYQELLIRKAEERDAARKNWATIENIKNLKEGYLSQAIHVIVEMMLKYQAVVVIEDYNFGFLRGRQMIEKNIYQKFVTMLISKLNYLVDKNADENAECGLYQAYQLTSKFESLKTLGKQTGVLFVAPAHYISNIDPVTGFVPLIYPKYENIASSKEFIKKIDDIYFDEEHNCFCFDINYAKFTAKSAGTKEQWTICSYGDRTRFIRNPEKNNRLEMEVVYPTKLFEELFAKYRIEYTDMKNGSLKSQILAQTEKEFYVEFMNVLMLTLKMRNHGSKVDYLISPVMNESGSFFDSRKEVYGLPSNIEANGSYNLARKGLMMLDKIRKTEDEKLGKESLALSTEEWLRFAQNI